MVRACEKKIWETENIRAVAEMKMEGKRPGRTCQKRHKSLADEGEMGQWQGEIKRSAITATRKGDGDERREIILSFLYSIWQCFPTPIRARTSLQQHLNSKVFIFENKLPYCHFHSLTIIHFHGRKTENKMAANLSAALTPVFAPPATDFLLSTLMIQAGSVWQLVDFFSRPLPLLATLPPLDDWRFFLSAANTCKTGDQTLRRGKTTTIHHRIERFTKTCCVRFH